MAKIDTVRRACEDIGTWLSKDKEGNKDAMAAIAKIHTKAMGPEAEPTLIFQEIADFRQKFKIPAKVAASYALPKE